MDKFHLCPDVLEANEHYSHNHHNKPGDAKGNDQPRFPGELPRHRPHRWENFSDDHLASKVFTEY